MSFEKRIGERILVTGVDVGWATSLDRSRRLRRRKVPPTRATIRDVSMSGAGVLAPSAPSLSPGHVVQGDADDHGTFVARVKRRTETDEPTRTYYGIEFLELSEEFQDWLNDLLGEARPNRTEEVWRHSH